MFLADVTKYRKGEQTMNGFDVVTGVLGFIQDHIAELVALWAAILSLFGANVT